MVTDIQAQELCELIKTNKDSLESIDVREASEYDEAHIECAKSIPMSEMQARIGEIDWSKDVILMYVIPAEEANIFAISFPHRWVKV